VGKRKPIDPQSLYGWERILMGKEEAMRRKRVRARQKYRYWQETWDKLAKTKQPEEIMWIIFEAIDHFHGWVYLSQAGYAVEALNLFLQDIGIKKES